MGTPRCHSESVGAEDSPLSFLKNREKNITLLKAHPEYSARKLAEVIGITDKAIEKHLAKLKAEGLIQREGPDKGGKWTVL